MPLRFRRRIGLVPGVLLNLNKRSVSTSLGRRGAHITAGAKGRRTTLGLPGTGLFYTTYRASGATGRVGTKLSSQFGIAIVILVLIAVIIGVLIR